MGLFDNAREKREQFINVTDGTDGDVHFLSTF